MPAPEEAFQSGHNTLGPFLSEAIVAPGPAAPFNECLILATICGRSLLHCQQHKISLAYGGLTVDWAAQNQRLDETLTLRLKAFSESYGSPATTMNGPLSDFVGIVGQTTVVYMCKGIMETLYSATNLGTSDNGKEEIQLRASNAIAAIISLLQPLREVHFSKVRDISFAAGFEFPVCIVRLIWLHRYIHLCLLSCFSVLNSCTTIERTMNRFGSAYRD
jgi:hypothetical protein